MGSLWNSTASVKDDNLFRLIPLVGGILDTDEATANDGDGDKKEQWWKRREGENKCHNDEKRHVP